MCFDEFVDFLKKNPEQGKRILRHELEKCGMVFENIDDYVDQFLREVEGVKCD